MKKVKHYIQTLTRLNLIINKLANNEQLLLEELKEELNVSYQVIKFDLTYRLAKIIPIVKTYENKYKLMDDYIIDYSITKNKNFLGITMALNWANKNNINLREASCSYLNNQLKLFTNQINCIHDKLPCIAIITSKLYKAIDLQKETEILYCDKEDKIVNLKIYRILEIDNIWYVIGNDIKINKIKLISIDQIQDIKIRYYRDFENICNFTNHKKLLTAG